MDGRSHSKDDKRKCSGIRNMWHYGTIETKPSSEEIPDQMMDFLSQMENL